MAPRQKGDPLKIGQRFTYNVQGQIAVIEALGERGAIVRLHHGKGARRVSRFTMSRADLMERVDRFEEPAAERAADAHGECPGGAMHTASGVCLFGLDDAGIDKACAEIESGWHDGAGDES